MPFKFSFPLPGRKPSDAANSSPIWIDTPNDSHDDSPLSDPGCKAERVLGCFDAAEPHAIANKSSRKALRKKPSYMNVTLLEVENEAAVAKDGFPFPNVPGSGGSSRRPSYNLRNQPSSPLLGERFHKGSPGTESMSDSPSPRPHFYGSSSTLRSYYDPAMSPLSISQQTSASSARDMALRKGHHSIASPLSQDVSNEGSPSIEDEGRPDTDHAPKRRPAQLEIPTRFPKARISSLPATSPHEATRSPSQLSHSSSQHSASSGRSNWWKRKKAKESNFKEGRSAPEDARLDQFDLGLDTLKTNIRKPKAGTRHWFDGVDDGHIQGGQHGPSDADEVHRLLWNKRLDKLRPERDDQPAGKPEQRSLDEPALDEKRVSKNAIDTRPGILHDIRCPLQQDTPHPAKSPMARSRGSTSTDAKADLSNQSFLELSSSSDEETEDPGVLGYSLQPHSMRDKADQNSINDDVHVSSTDRSPHDKPKAVSSPSPRRSKRGSEIIPPVPKIPERPQLQQRVSSIKWRKSQGFQSPTMATRIIHDSTSSSAGASITSQSSSCKQAGIESQLKKAAHGSKLMTVTVEEGELLEAMRQTRASIRQDAFSEGYTRAIHSTRHNHTQPRTSGTDGPVSYLGSDRSITPPPSLVNTNASPQSFRFPDVPSSTDQSNISRHNLLASPTRRTPKPPRQAPPIVFPPPKASPTDSFSPSDILPSTPGSRLSPRTPSFTTQEEDGLHNGFGGIGDQSPGGGGGGGKKGAMGLGKVGEGHLRKRTVSSVVMLDGMEERARVWEEGEEEWLEGRGERW
ncbi:MAG: hypothetical protein Q9207_001972 [Kuettlingeria erythrocarpa]